MLKKLLSCVVIAAFPLSLFAARPFIIDDAGTVKQGLFELEAAADFWKERSGFGAGLKHGLTSRMDLGVAFGYAVVPKDRMAATPLELSLKYNFIPEHLSASVTTSFDSVYAINAIYSHSLKTISLNANLGMEARGSIKEVVLTYGLSSILSIGRISLGAEIGGTQEEINWWQFGTQVSIKDWLAFDIGLGGDFQKDVELSATTGLWVAFPVEKNQLK